MFRREPDGLLQILLPGVRALSGKAVDEIQPQIVESGLSGIDDGDSASAAVWILPRNSSAASEND